MRTIGDGQATRTPGIGGSGPAETELVPAVRPADELAEILRALALRGTTVHEGTTCPDGNVRVDLVVSGRRGRFGIVCDALDSEAVRRRPSLLGAAGLDNVYCVSALDCVLDPEGIARALRRHEAGFFRRPRALAPGAPPRIERVRSDDPERLSPQPNRRSGFTVPVRAA